MTKNKTAGKTAEVLQLHKGMGSGIVKLKEIVNVDMGYTIRVFNPEEIETQRFIVGDPEGDEEKKSWTEDPEQEFECVKCGTTWKLKDSVACPVCEGGQ